MNDSLQKEMNLLLSNFWITKEENKEDYYLLKRNQNAIKNFVNKNLGNKLIVHDRFIKLEKIPALASPIYGIPSFTTNLDYVILFLFLLYLEDKPRGEKFILSSLIEYIKNTAVTLELNHIPDWNYVENRRSLIRVLDYLQELHIIILKDEDKKNFQDTKEADALYEVTGLSNYLIPSFDYEIFTLSQPNDFLKTEWGEQSEERGDIRRYKVYRNLLYSPVTLRKEITESEDDYFKKMHKMIEKELSDNLDLEVEITKNMAFVYAPETLIQKDYFPSTKKISDIVLLMNQKIIEFFKNEQILLDETECFVLLKSDFQRILKEVREDKKDYFSKQYLDMSFDKYQEEVISYMKNFKFLKEEENLYIINPIIYRFLGKTKNIKDQKVEEQIQFGGDFDEI